MEEFDNRCPLLMLLVEMVNSCKERVSLANDIQVNKRTKMMTKLLLNRCSTKTIQQNVYTMHVHGLGSVKGTVSASPMDE